MTHARKACAHNNLIIIIVSSGDRAPRHATPARPFRDERGPRTGRAGPDAWRPMEASTDRALTGALPTHCDTRYRCTESYTGLYRPVWRLRSSTRHAPRPTRRKRAAAATERSGPDRDRSIITSNHKRSGRQPPQERRGRGHRTNRYIPKPFLKRQTHAGKQGLLS